MPATDTALLSAIGRYGANSRRKRGDPAKAAAALADIRAIQLEHAIEQAVRAPVPLSAEARIRLVALLTAGDVAP